MALGGSRARGTHHDDSDIDLGLYYDPAALEVPGLQAATAEFSTAEFSTDGTVQIAAPGGWGPWVDGGGWLTVQGTAVDWILRDVGRVREQCDRARRGEFAFHSQPGHPLGFLDVAYAGEVAECIPLADPHGVLKVLKALVEPYPERLRVAMLENLWLADFHAKAAAKGIPRQDITYVLLCCTSALMMCGHAWHAAAGRWPTNEKGLLPGVAALDIDSHDFTARAADALTIPTRTRRHLQGAVDNTTALVALTQRALGRGYSPLE